MDNFLKKLSSDLIKECVQNVRYVSLFVRPIGEAHAHAHRSTDIQANMGASYGFDYN